MVYKFKKIHAGSLFFCALMKWLDNLYLSSEDLSGQRQAQNIANHFQFSQTQKCYLNANFVIFSRKYDLYIDFRFLFYIFAAGFHFKQRQS